MRRDSPSGGVGMLEVIEPDFARLKAEFRDEQGVLRFRRRFFEFRDEQLKHAERA